MAGLSLAVCACTYRRPAGLHALLEGLERQTFAAEPPPVLRVVIADNEGSDEVRAICAAFRERTGLPLTYVHEPRRGIPFARNACLDNMPTDCAFFAFVDDDEVPAPDWLDQLLEAQRRSGADVIAGRVVPVFAEGTPAWIAEGGFFGAPRRSYDLDMPKLRDLQELDRAATNNVLASAEPVRRLGLRFDTADFALSGGSDTLFFRTLREHGSRIVYAEGAVVHDHIPASRATLRYMFRERFRIANINTVIDAIIDGRPRPAPASALHGARHLGLAARRICKTAISKKRSRDRFAVGLFQAAHGLGMIAAALGHRYQHYR
ncbi:MAG: glycosyltransferase [Rhodospirillales bacterium]|nr:glycosyltransferase [Rhodospirillales bacterium]